MRAFDSIFLNKYIFPILVLLLVFLFTTLPFLNLFVFSFLETGGLKEWWAVITSGRSLEALSNTFLLVGARAVIGITMGILIAWLIARTNMPFRKTIEFMFWIAYFLPPLTMATGWIILFHPNYGAINMLWMDWFGGGPLFDMFSYAGITLAHLSTSTLPIYVMLLTPAFRYLSTDLEEASQMSGGNFWHLMRYISIPLIVPTLLVTMILSITRGLEAFEVEQILGLPAGIHVFSTLIYEHINWQPPDFAAAASLSTFFAFILFLMVMIYRWVVKRRDYTTVTGRGFNSNVIDLGGWRFIPSILCMLLIAFMLFLPLIALLIGTFTKRFGFYNIPNPITLHHWKNIVTNDILINSLKNSLLIAFTVAIAGVLIYALLAYFIQRSQSQVKGVIDIMIWIPWAFSGILLGFAMLRFLLGTSLLHAVYGTIFSLIILLIIKETPLGVQIIKGSLFQMNSELEEASKIAGASNTYTFFNIVLPLLKPTLLSVSIIAFVGSIREIGGFVLLTSPGIETLSVMLLNLLEDQRVEQSAVLGVILSIIIAAVVLIARRFGLNISPGGK